MSKKLTDFFVSSSKEKTTLLEENEQGASNSRNESNSADDIGSHNVATNDSIEKPFHLPITFSFPKTKFGKKNRSCQASWFVKFPWLHYDAE